MNNVLDARVEACHVFKFTFFQSAAFILIMIVIVSLVSLILSQLSFCQFFYIGISIPVIMKYQNL